MLVQDIPGVGAKGTMTNVSTGYYRNYLFPRGLAAPTTEAFLRQYFKGSLKSIYHASDKTLVSGAEDGKIHMGIELGLPENEILKTCFSELKEPPSSCGQQGKSSTGTESQGRCNEDGLADHWQVQYQEEGWAEQPDFWEVRFLPQQAFPSSEKLEAEIV